MANTETEQIPAKFVFHLFREDRPGQHRAVPEISSTLNLGAISRRYREATVVSAENIANFSLFLKTQETPENGADLARPFSSMPIEKGMMTALPAGIDAYQPKPEQPPATYDTFIDSQVAETARPLNQSKNIAMCDSSGYSFSGGKLDHLTYFVGVDTDQADIETLVLDPLFELWFAEAVLYYGWTLNPESPPAHSWDWPARPQIDEEKTATARKTNLSTGVMSLRRAYAEDGLDFDDELPAMAEDYGVSVDEMRKILLESNFAQTAQPKPQKMNDNTDPPPAPNRNGTAPRNGFARSTR
jgi:capsid protein